MINRAVIIGRLTSDVEVRKTQSGLSVSTFTVAVPDSRNKDITNFINCVAWRQSADFLGQYSHKGDLVAVDGKITTRSYERDGHKVYVTELVADEVQFIQVHSDGNYTFKH
jgi:single-strand DNA-binding protein